MALNSNYARVYADAETAVYVAKLGTTLPTDLTTAPGTGFADVGWLGEDGIKLTVDKDIADFTGLQGGGIIRRKVSKVTQKITLVLNEDSAISRYLMYGVKPTLVGTAPAQYATMTPGSMNLTLTMAAVIDLIDGDQKDRYVFGALDLTFSGDVDLAKGDGLRQVPIEATVIAGSPFTIMTNSAGVISASSLAAVTAF